MPVNSTEDEKLFIVIKTSSKTTPASNYCILGGMKTNSPVFPIM